MTGLSRFEKRVVFGLAAIAQSASCSMLVMLPLSCCMIFIDRPRKRKGSDTPVCRVLRSEAHPPPARKAFDAAALEARSAQRLTLALDLDLCRRFVDRKRQLEADFPLKRFIQVLAVDFSPDG
ncbi:MULTISPECIES: hypothetical protein [unclassified Mesorhizobium]|uniref:hypothetical protein n=1 Tax=unclassified Mesorhizobium TaxID=325217 RepID=UPI00167EB72B|nr:MULTISPECIES: hypothetical protein [unclassified Mesorhizobium]